MKKGKERQAWLDYVRFFSILLVIVFHTPPRMALFDDAVILNLRVPVFFCISGFLYSFDKWPDFWTYVRHRAQQILVPYTTFFVIFYALWLVVGRRMVGAEEEAISVWQPLKEFVLGQPATVVAPFWYIACLFTMQLLYYGIEKLVPRRWVFATCLALGVGTYLIPYENTAVAAIGLFWHLGDALLFLPFYALGNSFKQPLQQMHFGRDRKGFTAALVVLGIASMVGMALIQPVKDVDPGLYKVLRIFAGLMVIPAYMCVAKWIAGKFGHISVVEFVVVSGTVYLGLQNYFIGIAKMLLNKLCYAGVMDDQWWLKFVVAILVMAAIYPFAWLIDRYAPWLLGKSTSHHQKTKPTTS